MCSNMAAPRDYQTKWSKPEKDKCIWYCLYEESKIKRKKKIQMNLQTKQNRPTDRENKFMATKGEGAGINYESGIMYNTIIHKIDNQQGSTV